MHPKQSGGIANCPRRPQGSRASQHRDVRKTAGLPVPRLCVAATCPFAPTRLEIVCELPTTRARQCRDRGSRAALTFRLEMFAVHWRSVATKLTRSRLEREQGHKQSHSVNAVF